jgi:hypothetical protein
MNRPGPFASGGWWNGADPIDNSRYSGDKRSNGTGDGKMVSGDSKDWPLHRDTKEIKDPAGKPHA